MDDHLGFRFSQCDADLVKTCLQLVGVHCTALIFVHSSEFFFQLFTILGISDQVFFNP